MADIITIVSSVLKNDTYPKYVDITAPYGCGTVSILLDDSYTEQMRQELPNITINIYTEHDGERVLFTSRALSMPVNSTKLKFSTILKGIPNECIIAFIPEFDNNAFISHNNNAVVTGDEVWSAPITEFDQPAPISAYGKTKYEGEKFVQQFADRWFIVRTAWLYGDGKNFVKTMLKLAETHDCELPR